MRIESLTFLRFIAALVVIISHFGVHISLFENTSLAGQLMVTFFFVLSGFVMTVSQYHKADISLIAFWRDRLSRIAPVYFLSMGFMISYVISHNLNIERSSIVLNILFLQSWFSKDVSFALNYPSWTLSVEMTFYLLFPFVLHFIKKSSITSMQALFFSIILWSVTQLLISLLMTGDTGIEGSITNNLICYHPLVHLCSFLLGVAGGHYVLDYKPRIRSTVISLASFWGIILLLITTIMNATFLQQLPIELGSSFSAPLFLLFVVIIASANQQSIKILQSRVCILLGKSSYSLYILQIPLRSIYQKSIGKVLNLSPELDFLALLFFMVIASILSFTLFERPVNTFLRSSIPRIKVITEKLLSPKEAVQNNDK